MSDTQDMFAVQIEVAAQKRAVELLNDPKHLRMMLARLADEKAELEAQVVELEENSNKWVKYLDADGYIDVGEVADHIKVAYIPPSGKARHMGRNHFCQMLAHDQVIVHSNSGYRIHSRHRDALERFAKVFTKPISDGGRIKSSVKFNTKGLNWLHDRYTSDNRVWRSNSAGELYYE